MNGDGSLYWHKSTNRWVAQLNCQNGKRKYKYHTNKREANALLKQMIRDDKLGDITNNIKVSATLSNQSPSQKFKQNGSLDEEISGRHKNLAEQSKRFKKYMDECLNEPKPN